MVYYNKQTQKPKKWTRKKELEITSVQAIVQADEVGLEEISNYVHLHQEVGIIIVSHRFRNKKLLDGDIL